MKYLLMLLITTNAYAFSDYDVSWIPIEEKGVSMLYITIDMCVTQFKIKDKDLQAFKNSKHALEDAIDKAIAHKNSGCKN